MTLSSIIGRSRPRPARPRTRAAGPRAAGCTVVEITNHYTVRPGGRVYRDAVCRHADGSLWTHLLPTEAAA